MPKEAAIKSEDLLPFLLSANGVINKNGTIPGPTQQVWKDISAQLEGKIRPNYIYQRVKSNRDNLYSKIKTHHGICSPTISSESHDEDNLSDIPSQHSEESNDDVPVRPKKTFLVTIPSIEWNTIKPIETTYKRKDRNKLRKIQILPPYKWESVLIELLWAQHKIPCPYTFLRGRVSTDVFNREQYVKIEAKCTECGAKGCGRILNEPIENEALQMEWRAEDTRGKAHKKKRFLSGDKRYQVGKDTAYSSSIEYRRNAAKNLMDLGDIAPPHLYNTAVLRKAKQEYKNMNIDVIHGSDPIMCLEIMKHEQPHCGSIHDIGQDKFFVHYYTPSQLHIYKMYWKAQYVVLCIDATGTLVQKILRLHGPSDHIYLYEGVMITKENKLPVLQMLSEKQDANSILYWINEWERCGAPCPREVVIDNSAALKAAISRSFGRSSDVKQYKQKCFHYLTGRSNNLPPCFIRLDVAHFINAAKRWKIWTGHSSLKRVQDFYLRCLGLLIKTETIADFRQILLHILTMAISTVEGQNEDGEFVSMEESLRFLSHRIKGSPELENDKVKLTNYEVEYRLSDCDGLELKKETPECIIDWIHDIKKEAEEKCHDENGRINPYYSLEVANNFLRLTHDFTMWSAVMVKAFASPHITASSAAVEGYFSELKTNILKGETKPLLIHKFVNKHLNSITGSCKLVTANIDHNLSHHSNIQFDEAKATIFSEEDTMKDEKENNKELQFSNCASDSEDIMDSEDNEAEIAPKDLNSLENWRNKIGRKAPSKKKSRYLNHFPELDAALHDQRLKQPTNCFLRNGNLTPFTATEKNTLVKIKNTCAFDSLVSIIANAYIEVKEYRKFIDESENLLLRTSKSLATVGAVQQTYKLRAETLCTILEPTSSLPMPSSLSRKKQIVSLEYDSWSNITTLAKDLLQSTACMVVKADCPNKECKRIKETRYQLVDTNTQIILSNGFTDLSRAVAKSLKVVVNENSNEIDKNILMSQCITPCSSSPKIIIDTREHIFVDIDYLGIDLPLSGQKDFNRAHSLEEIPLQWKVAGKNYMLLGLVAYRPGHYVAYNRRISNGTWDLHDDLSRKIMSNVSPKEKIIPHLLFFATDFKH